MGASAIAAGGMAGLSMINRTLAAKDQIKTARKNAERQVEELSRQQRHMGQIAASEKGDAVRRYEKEIGTMRAAAAEAGASGASFTRLTAEIGGNEGRALGRIQDNYAETWGEAQAAKISTIAGYNQGSKALANSVNAANFAAIVGFAGLEIGGDPGAAAKSLEADNARNIQATRSVDTSFQFGAGGGGGPNYERTSRRGGIGGY